MQTFASTQSATSDEDFKYDFEALTRLTKENELVNETLKDLRGELKDKQKKVRNSEDKLRKLRKMVYSIEREENVESDEENGEEKRENEKKEILKNKIENEETVDVLKTFGEEGLKFEEKNDKITFEKLDFVQFMGKREKSLRTLKEIIETQEEVIKLLRRRNIKKNRKFKRLKESITVN